MEETEKKKAYSKWWLILIGFGMAVIPIHNTWLTRLATIYGDKSPGETLYGETLFFLPAFGYLLLIMGAGMFLLYNWNRVRAAGLGDNQGLFRYKFTDGVRR